MQQSCTGGSLINFNEFMQISLRESHYYVCQSVRFEFVSQCQNLSLLSDAFVCLFFDDVMFVFAHYLATLHQPSKLVPNETGFVNQLSYASPGVNVRSACSMLRTNICLFASLRGN